MAELLHVTEAARWAPEAGVACPPGGFIHLCTAAQLPFVLARHFVGRSGLVVLRIDAAGLDVRWEASEAGMPPFPHLYEALPAHAVLGSAGPEG